MKHLQVNYIGPDKIATGIAGVSALMDSVPKQVIDNLLWSTDGYKPDVKFAIAYTADSILLKYFVKETYVKTSYHEINDPVYKDSCVEFFIAFGNDENYYNLEFNSIGTPLIGYGAANNNREYLHNSAITPIKSHNTKSQTNEQGDTDWELTLNIPFTVFVHHHITVLTDSVCRANFYKCGDDLPVPHFLSWCPVNHPAPNFHLPQFFGTLQFI